MNFSLFDLHVHTSEVSPCGRMPARQVVELYRQAGYDGIVITDHYHEGTVPQEYTDWQACAQRLLAGWQAARAAGEELGLTVLLGTELRFRGDPNDYLVYGLSEDFFYQHENLCGRMDIKTFYQTFGGQYLVVNAHPFRDGNFTLHPDWVDGIEVVNQNIRHQNFNERARALAAAKPGCIQTAASDAHKPEDVARAGMLLPGPVTDNASLLAALRKNPLLCSLPEGM